MSTSPAHAGHSPAGAAPLTRRASRSKRKARRLRLAARVAVLAMVAGGITGFAALHKTVTLDVDGQRIDVTTLSGSVGDLLAAQGVSVLERDLVVPAVTASVPRSGEILVRTARELDLEIDGQTQTLWTTAETVEDALADLGVRAEAAQLSVSRSAPVARLSGTVRVSTPKAVTVTVDGEAVFTQTNADTVAEALTELGVGLGQNDTVSQPLEAPAVDGLEVTVSRAVAKDGKKTKTVPFKTKKVKDPNLLKGEEKVVQKGRVGERVVTYTATVVEGEEVDREVLTEVVVSTPRDKIVKIGTKEPPEEAAASGGSAPNVSISVPAGSSKAIARGMVSDDAQFACLVALWNRESGWRVNAQNRSSGAYGIPQALPGSKMASAGSDWRTNPATQIKWGLGYIKGRYGTPCGAWSAFQSKGWY